MKRKLRDFLKETLYLLLVMVLIVGSIPVQPVLANEGENEIILQEEINESDKNDSEQEDNNPINEVVANDEEKTGETSKDTSEVKNNDVSEEKSENPSGVENNDASEENPDIMPDTNIKDDNIDNNGVIINDKYILSENSSLKLDNILVCNCIDENSGIHTENTHGIVRFNIVFTNEYENGGKQVQCRYVIKRNGSEVYSDIVDFAECNNRYPVEYIATQEGGYSAEVVLLDAYYKNGDDISLVDDKNISDTSLGELEFSNGYIINSGVSAAIKNICSEYTLSGRSKLVNLHVAFDNYDCLVGKLANVTDNRKFQGSKYVILKDGMEVSWGSLDEILNQKINTGNLDFDFEIGLSYGSGNYSIELYIPYVKAAWGSNLKWVNDTLEIKQSLGEIKLYSQYYFDQYRADSDKERITVEDLLTDKIVVDGKVEKLEKEYNLTLSNYNQKNEGRPVSVCIEVNGFNENGEALKAEIDRTVVSFSGDSTEKIKVTFRERGTYRFTVKFSGNENIFTKDNDNNYYTVGSDFYYNLTNTDSFEIGQDYEQIIAPYLSQDTIMYGGCVNVYDNSSMPGELTSEEVSSRAILSTVYNSKNTYRAVKMNKDGKAVINVWRKETIFYKQSDVASLGLTVNKVKPVMNLKPGEDITQVNARDQLQTRVEYKFEESSQYSDLFEKDLADRNIKFEYKYIDENGKEISEIKKVILDCVDAVHKFQGYKNDTEEPIFKPGKSYGINVKFTYNDSENSPYIFEEALNTFNVVKSNAVISACFSGENDNVVNRQYDYKKMLDKKDYIALSINGKNLGDKEKKNIKYTIRSSDEKVVSIVDKDIERDGTTDKVDFKITGCGEATITVAAQDETQQYELETITKKVVVNNSQLQNDDYTINLKDDSGNTIVLDRNNQFAYLNNYLIKQNGWINGSIEIKVNSDDIYYNLLGYSYTSQDSNIITKEDSTVLNISDEALYKTDYTFWTVHSSNNATAKANDNPAFTVGIDRISPKVILVEGEENKENTSGTVESGERVRYFPQDFKYSYKINDAASGIKQIEYSTDAGKTWKTVNPYEALNVNSNTEILEFEQTITLTHGIHEGLSVKVTDVAGNETELRYTDDSGQYIKMIVDTKKPEIALTSVYDNGEEYTSEWTNRNVDIIMTDVSEDVVSGIDYYEIKFVSIGQNADDVLWEKFTQEDHPEYKVCLGAENVNGTYYFKATSKAGHESEEVSSRVRIQHEMAKIVPIDETKFPVNPKNEWYNHKSGVPHITFEYPEYKMDNYTYEAPITLYYDLSVKGTDATPDFTGKRQAKTGVDSDDKYHSILASENWEVPSDDLKNLEINFGINSDGIAVDGIYTLVYWIEDEAGNKSEELRYEFKIDTTNPQKLEVFLDGNSVGLEANANVYYNLFSQKTVTGNATCEYGVSGKDSLKILKAKNIGDWNSNGNWIENSNDSFSIEPCTRCFIYAIAEDLAGNTTEIYTSGVVVDNQKPAGQSGDDLFTKPDGANEYEFYNKDFDVDIFVQDMPKGDDYSGLRNVTYKVGRGQEVISTKEIYSSSLSKPTWQQIEATKSFKSTERVNAVATESNEAYIEVTAVDVSDNISTTTKKVKIDVTKPVIDITFDNSDVLNGHYYNANRTAAVHVNELNFDPSRVSISVTKDTAVYHPIMGEWVHNGNNHFVTVTFSEDGDYTMSVDCTDMADNKSETVMVEEFTVDKTLPELTVSYDNNNSYKEGYYAAERTATITVIEHNFDSSFFTLQATPEMQLSTWLHDGDKHWATISFTNDGLYEFGCSYTDLAGNNILPMEAESFYIDTVAPQVIISGVANDSANSGDVAPVVTISDDNFDADGVSIKLTTGYGETVGLQSANQVSENGYVYDLSQINNLGDNIYYLEVTSVDKSGNATTVTYRFSLNRNGSTYDISKVMDVVDKGYNKYIDIEDMQIMEMNVDPIDKFTVYISRNGELLKSRQVDSRPASITDEICYSIKVEGDEKIGYNYMYTLYRENFEAEGEYNIGFYSKDRAGNEVNNTLDEKDANMHFIVDNSVPTVIIDGVESDTMYNVDAKIVNVLVTDNFKLKEARIFLVDETGKELMSWNYMDLVNESGEIATIEIPSYEGKLSLLYSAVDAAGNEVVAMQDSEEAPKAFIITTNVWTQLKNSKKTKKTAATAAGGVVVTGIGTSLFIRRRRKRF